MNKQPILSLLIPTKNRFTYLINLLGYLSEIESDEFEIVIQDNSEINKEITDYLRDIKDNRIKYFHQPEWLSVSDNCELAIQRSTGEYICMIGDDDGVTPQILDVVQWMKDSDIDAVLSSKPTYHWPGIVSRLDGQTETGRLYLHEYDGLVHKIDVDIELQKVLKNGATNIYLLPRVYHGIVSRKCLDQLRAIAGTCFPGPSPDMANAVGLTCVVKTLFHINLPIIINGNCPSSTGGLGARAAHHGEIHEISFLPKDTAEKWPVQIPKFWSGPTILATSAVFSLSKTNRLSLIQEINYPALYSICAMFHSEYLKRIFIAAKNSGSLNLKHYYSFAKSFVNIFLQRFSALRRNIFFKFTSNKVSADINGINSIEKAAKYVASTDNYKISLSAVLHSMNKNKKT